MIRRFRNWLLDVRIQHHSRRASLFGTAALLAQQNRDWPGAARCLEQMHGAQARRDSLLSKCNPCDRDCAGGRLCPFHPPQPPHLKGNP